MPTDSERIIELETRLTFQDDLLQQLNSSTIEQQQRIERLEATVHKLMDRIQELREIATSAPPDNERPPHY